MPTAATCFENGFSDQWLGLRSSSVLSMESSPRTVCDGHIVQNRIERTVSLLHDTSSPGVIKLFDYGSSFF